MEQAIEDYLYEKRGTFDPNKESTRLTIQKIAGILRPLALFLNDRGVKYLKDVKTEQLSAFQDTWQGRLAEAELERFALGDSSLFVVNLRELSAADAHLKESKALVGYHKAAAAYRSAIANW